MVSIEELQLQDKKDIKKEGNEENAFTLASEPEGCTVSFCCPQQPLSVNTPPDFFSKVNWCFDLSRKVLA